MPEAMVMQKWENILRKSGRDAQAEKIGSFRRRYGDGKVPLRYSERFSDLAYVELEHELRQALPYMPEEAFAQFVDGTYRFPMVFTEVREIHMKLTGKDFLARVEALLYAYYGTDAPLSRVSNTFSLKGAGVENAINDYLSSLNNGEPNKSPIKKLGGKIPAPEIPPGEPIKGNHDIWVYFRRLYIPEAKEIADDLDRGKVVVASGQRGSGKSFNLMVNMKREIESRNYRPLMKSGHGLSDATSAEVILGELFRHESPTLHAEPASADALIIDEAQKLLLGSQANTRTSQDAYHPENFFNRTEVAEAFFRKLKERKNARAVLINAGVNPTHRDYITKAFASAASEQGLDCVEHKMRTTQIPAELAVKHLEFIGAKRETIDFVSAPKNAAILSPRMFDNQTLIVRHGELGEVKKRLEVALGPPYWKELMQDCQGNSKAGMIEMLKNLGVLTEANLQEAMEIPDY
ncbi:MAG TPA: hypothetical protein VI933_03875 [archaeon]|nr:hypothetical protein [archaeon]